MIVEVTQEDIELGERGDCYMCPIARAVTRQLRTEGYNQTAWPRVTKVSIMISGFRTTRSPFKAVQFIQNFDDYGPVSPFSFELDLTPVDPTEKP